MTPECAAVTALSSAAASAMGTTTAAWMHGCILVGKVIVDSIFTALDFTCVLLIEQGIPTFKKVESRILDLVMADDF